VRGFGRCHTRLRPAESELALVGTSLSRSGWGGTGVSSLSLRFLPPRRCGFATGERVPRREPLLQSPSPSVASTTTTTKKPIFYFSHAKKILSPGKKVCSYFQWYMLILSQKIIYHLRIQHLADKLTISLKRNFLLEIHNSFFGTQMSSL